MPEPTQKYELSHLRSCRQIDTSQDGLQFLCISLCHSLLKNMSYPIPDHAEKLILAETVFNFYALSCAGACCNIVLGCCMDGLVNTKSLVSLQITSVCPFACKSVLVHSAYWSPRSKGARGISRQISPRSYLVGGLSKKAFAGHSFTTHDNRHPLV